MHVVHAGTSCTRMCTRVVHAHARGVTVSALTASGQPRPERPPVTAEERARKRLAYWEAELARASESAPGDARAELGVLWRWITSESRGARYGFGREAADSLLAEVASTMLTACRILAVMDPQTGQPSIQQEAS